MTHFLQALGTGLMLLGVLGSFSTPELAPLYAVGVVLLIIARLLELRRRRRA